MAGIIDPKGDMKPSIRKRGYYSEIITGTNEYPVRPKLTILAAAPRRTKLSWQVMTEHHAAIVKNLGSGPQTRFLGAAERWISFPEDRSIAFPAEAFAPKVQMEMYVEPKHIPRNVEMERRRRIYRLLKVEDALESEGVLSRYLLPYHVVRPLCPSNEFYGLRSTMNYLPLEIFDDMEYDCRTVDDWLVLGTIDGFRHPLPAAVFVENREEVRLIANDNRMDHLYGWYNAAVMGYNDDTKLWKVYILDGSHRTYTLPRIYIRFYAEDPRLFSKRIVAALKDRNTAEACIRYNFYIDCMQLDGMPTISQDKDNIMSLVLQNGKLKFNPKKIDAIVQEISLDYQRTMCDLKCRQLIETYPDVFQFVKWVPTNEETLVPINGKIDTGMNDFSKRKSLFHWITLYVYREVHEAMCCIVAECINVSDMTLFSLNYGKSWTLDDFEAQQTQTTVTTFKYLRERWLEKMTQSIRMCLRDIGKGWFNLEQKDHHVYDVMKLKRFMNLTMLRMQNALRNLVERSMTLYLHMLETPALCTLNVDDDFSWGSDLMDTQFKPAVNPVFNIQLTMNMESAYYSTDPLLFEKVIVSLFDNALRLCHQIRQVHPFLLTNLKFPQDLFLSSVGLMEELVRNARERLQLAYRKSLIPLNAYCKEYNQFLTLYSLDVPLYGESFMKESRTAAEVKEEISMHLRLNHSLEVTVPKCMWIGPYNVNVQPLKTFLVNKRMNLATTLLNMFAERLRIQTEEILEEYRGICRRLKEAPKNVEDIFELKEWMETIPLTVKNLDDGVQKLKMDFDILDFFRWNLSDADFQAKWEAIGYPLEIQIQVEESIGYLAEEQNKFYKIQLLDEINLTERIESLVGNLTNISLQMDINKTHETAIDVKRMWKMMMECQEQGLLLNERQKLFGVPVVPFEELTKLIKDFDPYKSLWLTASDWLKWYDIWMDNPLINIDGQLIDSMVNDMYKIMTKSAKTFQDQPKVANVAIQIRDQIETFKPFVGMMQSFRNPGMKPRHFEELSALTGIQMALTPTLTFKNLLVLGIMNYTDTVQEVAEGAAKEYAIEESLDKMIADWSTIKMEIIPHKNTGTYIMKIPDEIAMLLDDHILNTQQISFSPFRATFEDRITEWEAKLKLTQEIIAIWIEVQKAWLYLEPIFASEDISRQLPVEAKKYNTMERNWRRIMKNAHECPYIIEVCPDKTLFESLKECLTLLDVVQKGLSDYLETKRMIFPRFFFLSDDELLEILAQSKNVRAVQPHLKKCFENMKELRFEEDLRITRMYSAEYEEVVLSPSIYPEGNVENWLGLVEDTMRSTLRNIIGKSLEVVEETPRKSWVYMWPGQVVICAGQTYWSAHVEDGIVNNTLMNYYKLMLSHLDDLRELVRGQQTEIQRLMLEAVITVEVHARDVLYKLIQERVVNVNDFDWISQLRYYWVDGTDLKVRAVNAEFPYGYEYLGNNGRLVITPLTDRCYLTLTGALHLKFGGAPAGPAGTGKTETTKDLAKALAIQCVVFNCSDQLDFMSMGKFFKGLASAGAWACFDEFNRIDIEVLSVIAQQILTIQKAQQIRAERFMFEGVELSLKAACAVFITMNPGYAGRTELPDNLKALFRPVAMMVPNYTLIAEISLFSYGFSDAKNLAGKITTTFKLSSEQLSSQDHYDFGMRAVKTVIAVAGNLKREQRNMEEQQICLRALRDVNVPKFLKDDLKLFNGIVSDLFPKLVEETVDHGILEAGIRRSIKKMGLQDVNEYVSKVIQLYETTVVRHGLMLVGPTGSGKTRCYEILKDACTSLKGKIQPSGKPFTPVHTYVLNPKSITMGQLYGEYDLDTHEWTDGILSTLIRSGTAATDKEKRWYVFDGPVDAVWIENMNTVLDDNKKLCLTSGEIMKLLPTQTMMFEVADLKVASPATVSRCGMVYLEPGGLGLNPFIDCWLNSLPNNMADHLQEISQLTYYLVLPGLTFLRENLREIVATVDSGLIQSYINLMNFRIGPMAGREGKAPPSPLLQRTIPKLLTPWVAFSLVWSLGGSCDHRSRILFNNWLREMQKVAKHNLQFPAEGLVFDYRLHDGGFTDPIEDSEPIPPKWLKWLEDIPPIRITTDMKFADIEVPTMDNIRSGTLIGYLLLNETNILCVGPTGSGKTLTISAKLSRNMSKKYVCDFIVFSARTSANQTQDLIDSKLEKRRKGVYGPSVLKKQVFFIDDLNMPALEIYGAQPPIELIRQFMDFNGWYDRKEIGSFHFLEDVNFVAAMGPPGGGRNPVTSRLLRHFHYLAFPEMEEDSKKNIFGAILRSWLQRTTDFEYLLESMVSATLYVFSTISKELLPTPDKSHYTFNLRDLSKVFQGILMAEPDKMDSVEKLLALWYHENSRVFSDRLVNNEDREWFEKLMQKILKEYFKSDRDTVVAGDVLFFSDFCESNGQYERIKDLENTEKILLDFLYDYNNSTTAPMRLVLFQDAISHLCRIGRILRQPRGNALLLGMGGSGRRSLTKLSTHIVEYSCFQIELSKAYSNSDWREDLKTMMLRAGLQKRSIVFLFSDTQIKNDSFLEDLNNILNSGDVPNIYQSDELDRIFQLMRGPVQEAGLPTNRSNLFAAYQKIVRNNLHTVITMSPIGETFRARIRQFPAIVNCCTIDWFSPWPEAALQTVALQFLSEIQDFSVNEKILKSIVKTCQYMHSSVIEASEHFLVELNRHNYVTPTSYLELLSSYGDLLSKKKEELVSGISRLVTGLDKLASTEVEVKEMQSILLSMKPELDRATAATAEMIDEITKETVEAEKTKAKALEQEEEATKLKKDNQAIKDEAEADLGEARPMLEAAEASLKSLNKGDVTEVKAMKRPPVGVVLVIEAMCIVKDVKPNKIPGKMPGEKILDYWTPGSQMLADPGHFLSSLENFNKDEITEEMINRLKHYVENPAFQPQKVLQVSKACHSLCLWVHAMYNYYFVNLKVAPKMEALAKAEEALLETERTLALAMSRLKTVEEGIESLQKKLEQEQDKKSELERQKQLCEERMSRAVKLIAGLADEQERWINTVAQIEKSLKNVVGDILLSSGAIAYLTPFNDSYREKLMKSWYSVLGEGVPHTPGCHPVSTLGDAVEIRKWQMDGLPRDSLSVENAVLVTNSKRWPLFIDPQGQANKWIRNMGKTSGLSIVKMTDKDLVRVLENCVRFGRSCLIENIVTEMEAALDPILTRALFKQAGQLVIKIGDNIVPFSFDFRLYITTKLPNPHYTPEIAIKVLLVNFTLTISGFQDQMLSLVAMQERPDLEESRSALIVSSAQMKRDLKDIEDRILYRLSVSEGSAVDDLDLIHTLEASKVKSEEIKAKVQSAEITQADIDITRSLYIPVANRAQILFFCLSDLQYVDTMYQYSLEWFINIFVNSILSTDKAATDINKRISNINDNFTYALFSNVCRSLFEKHKLHFAFLLCARIHIDDNLIDPIEWRHFLSGEISPHELPNPAPNWVSTRCWKEIQALELLPKFSKFTSDFGKSIIEYRAIFDSQEPEKEFYPEPWQSRLDDFQKMLLLKCLRPDKITNSMQIYLTKYFGSRFVEPQAVELSVIFKESSPTMPLVFVLSTGTDPAAELYKFANRLKMAKKLSTISLGQGQGPRAELMLKESIEVGNWVFFQNCHLAPSWMPKLEQLVETLPETVHRDFRLWLTSTPSPDFPVSILQNGSKMTVEPPRGLKANMLRAYLTQVIEMQDFMHSEHEKVTAFKWLLFSLCMFHGALLERRKFGPLGFNIPYEFTDGDLTICISQLHMFLLEYTELPFKVLIYTAGHINYGGRITDDWDRRCVLTILQDFYDGKVVSPTYNFDVHEVYHQLPADTKFDDYINYIKTFPLNDDPAIFGLHPNADISYAQAETYACLETLLALQPKEIGSAVASMEDVTSQLAKDILSSIPSLFDLAVIQQRYPVLYKESLNTVLMQEAKRYNGLLQELKLTLQDLLKALKGLVVMSEKLETMAFSLFVNKVPKVWQDKGYASLKPLGAWVLDLKDRINFITSWQTNGIPPAFWISGFYFPQAFLTGTLQNYARKHIVSIDSIDFTFRVLNEKPVTRPEDGCVIYGLFLEGCRWSGTHLAESYPKELYTEMSPILFLPEVNHRVPETDIYECPVYKTIKRAGTLSTTGHSTNFVLSMEIPSKAVQSHWIKRGVAMICALDY
ncbi:dynein heavy chain 1, axonemal [Cephus cinctus]|uniref:Dynein heavy chain 1, axonemal n=1 Tax=Cephus cinctus TaxID=211228 RepID=A0AAJ7RGY0_CEPCN|nr:dynein heavy chain 1, axonemal [Cephus cinctus]